MVKVEFTRLEFNNMLISGFGQSMGKVREWHRRRLEKEFSIPHNFMQMLIWKEMTEEQFNILVTLLDADLIESFIIVACYYNMHIAKEKIRKRRSTEEYKEQDKIRGRKYREKYRDRVRENARKNYHKNKDKNKDKRNKEQRERYHKNKEAMRIKRKEYYEKNKDDIRRKQREYYHKNKEK